MIDRITMIHDPEDERIRIYLNQRDAWLKAAHNPEAGEGATSTGLDDPGLFMTEGALVLDQHLRSGYPLSSVLVAQERVEALGDLLARVPEDVPIYSAPRELLSSITGFAMHRGLLAAGRRVPDRDPMELARTSRTSVILEDIANHDNVGSIFRSTAAICGSDSSVLISPRSCDPLYRKALRVSIGCALRVPFGTLDPFAESLGVLRDEGIPILAMTPADDAIDLEQIPNDVIGSARIGVLLGAEGPGLTKEAMDSSTIRVRIPIVDWVDSLNIGVACGVVLHDIERRRRSVSGAEPTSPIPHE